VMAIQQFDSFEDLLKTYVPEQQMLEVRRMLYGGTSRCLLITEFS